MAANNMEQAMNFAGPGLWEMLVCGALGIGLIAVLALPLGLRALRGGRED